MPRLQTPVRYAFLFLALGCLLASALAAQETPATPAAPAADLAEYKTTDTAVTAATLAPAINKLVGAGYLGLAVHKSGTELVVTEVLPGSPAEKSGLKGGDVLLKVEGSAPASADTLREFIQSKREGDKLAVQVRRQLDTRDLTVTVAAISHPQTANAGNSGAKEGAKKDNTKGAPQGDVKLPYWKKGVYRLAVIPIDFADITHNDKISAESWRDALFSRESYTTASATGQRVFGSLNDYFHEQSFGKFQFEGHVFEPVTLAKKRADYVQGSGTSNKTAVLNDALAKLDARQGNDPLKNIDGLCFIYAGARVQGNAGSVYYPHQGSLTYQGKRWPYVFFPEGGKTMESLSGYAKEMGQLLGLPDLAAKPDPGSEGLGVWCLMSNGAGNTGRPTHLSAWCKEQLGWIAPTIIDPTVKQKIILSPVTSSPHECLKIIVRLDGSEYFLLENRRLAGFDASLPAPGLLIWRVVGDAPTLEEAHGILGPKGPLTHLDAIPFPSPSNHSFTPETTPSSRSVTGGGLPVHITNIRRLDDGRVALDIGYEYY